MNPEPGIRVLFFPPGRVTVGTDVGEATSMAPRLADTIESACL